MSNKIEFSIVIPAYNEEARISRAILESKKYLKSREIRGEIIVVDDGSKDKTSQIAQKFSKTNPPVKVLRFSKNQGKGGAVKRGMLEAQGEIIAFTDTDLSTPLKEFNKLLAKFKKGYDLVIGSRGVKGARVQRHQKWYREWAGKVFHFLDKLLFIYGIGDTQCGFKAFKSQAAKKIFSHLTSTSAIWDMEALFLATRFGYRTKEVGVEWVHDSDTRLPYNLKRTVKIFQELLRLRRHYRVGLPVKIKT